MSETERIINNLKGRVAESIFHQMFEETKKFIIYPFGYEYLTPELAHYRGHIRNPSTIDSIRNSPDFLLIYINKTGNRDTVYFVEVKYQHIKNTNYLLENTKELNEYWPNTSVFLATPGGFFFGKHKDLIKNKEIQRLNIDWVSEKIQDKYLDVINSVNFTQSVPQIY